MYDAEMKGKKHRTGLQLLLLGLQLGSLTKIALKVKSQQNENLPQTTILYGLLQIDKMVTLSHEDKCILYS